MSLPRSNSPGEDSLVNLTLEFQGLTIRVEGPADRSADFVRRLSGPQFQDLPGGSHGTPEPAPSASGASSTRNSIELGFDPIPADLLALSSRLSGSSSRLSGADRLRRAWRAGQWAQATRSSQVASPNRTPAIDLPNRVYVVLWSPQRPTPIVLYTSRDFFAEVGDLDNSEAICHGFPSQLEARVYLAAAGEIFPDARP